MQEDECNLFNMTRGVGPGGIDAPRASFEGGRLPPRRAAVPSATNPSGMPLQSARCPDAIGPEGIVPLTGSEVPGELRESGFGPGTRCLHSRPRYASDSALSARLWFQRVVGRGPKGSIPCGGTCTRGQDMVPTSARLWVKQQQSGWKPGTQVS